MNWQEHAVKLAVQMLAFPAESRVQGQLWPKVETGHHFFEGASKAHHDVYRVLSGCDKGQQSMAAALLSNVCLVFAKKHAHVSHFRQYDQIYLVRPLWYHQFERKTDCRIHRVVCLDRQPQR